MKLKFLTGLMVILVSAFNSYAQPMDTIRFITEEYPPFNFKAENEVRGISVDFLLAALEKMNSPVTRKDIELLPWARGYNFVQEKPDTCLFAMTRTAARENLFQWAGPIAPTKISVFALKSRNIKISSREDLKPYTAGVILEDVSDTLAQEAGIRKIQRASENRSNLNKLLKDRIDLWIYEESVGKWQIRSMGFNPDDFEVVYVLTEAQLYFAFNKNTPVPVVSGLQKALDQVRAEGQYQKILDTYLK